VATSLNNLAVLLSDRERYPDAEGLYRDALAMRRKLLGEDHPETIQSINAVGYILLLQGRYAEAEPFLRDAHERQLRVLGPDNVSTAMNELNLARVLLATKHPDQAESVVRHALATCRAQTPDDWHIGVGEGVLGQALTALGRLDEAEPHLLEGYTLLNTKKGKDATITRVVRGWLIDHYQARGMTARADEIRAVASDAAAR
jgi:tetratricopeptide (TPR) repeat protein